MLRTDLIAPIPELLRRQAAARGDKCAYRDAHTSVTYAALDERTGKLAGASRRQRHRRRRYRRDLAAELGRVGGELLRHCPRRRHQRSDQLRLDRNRDRLSPERCQLQGGHHHRRAWRSFGAAEKLRAQSCDLDRDRSRQLQRAGAALCGSGNGRRPNRRRAIRLRCTTPLSFSTRPAPPAAPKACSSPCTACCGSMPPHGRRSPACPIATRCCRRCRCFIPTR